jgi:hypothetical protein
MSAAVAGIDPGNHGAVAVVCDDPKTAICYLLSDFMNFPMLFKDLMRDHDVQHVYIEKAMSLPHNGGVAMLNYGTGFGRIVGWLDMLQLPYTMVRPQTWCKEMHKGVSGKDAKTKSEIAVRQLFPTENLCIEGSRKIHSGFMDARLIAEYGKRVFK